MLEGLHCSMLNQSAPHISMKGAEISADISTCGFFIEVTIGVVNATTLIVLKNNLASNSKFYDFEIFTDKIKLFNVHLIILFSEPNF